MELFRRSPPARYLGEHILEHVEEHGHHIGRYYSATKEHHPVLKTFRQSEMNFYAHRSCCSTFPPQRLKASGRYYLRHNMLSEVRLVGEYTLTEVAPRVYAAHTNSYHLHEGSRSHLAFLQFGIERTHIMPSLSRSNCQIWPPEYDIEYIFPFGFHGSDQDQISQNKKKNISIITNGYNPTTMYRIEDLWKSIS